MDIENIKIVYEKLLQVKHEAYKNEGKVYMELISILFDGIELCDDDWDLIFEYIGYWGIDVVDVPEPYKDKYFRFLDIDLENICVDANEVENTDVEVNQKSEEEINEKNEILGEKLKLLQQEAAKRKNVIDMELIKNIFEEVDTNDEDWDRILEYIDCVNIEISDAPPPHINIFLDYDLLNMDTSDNDMDDEQDNSELDLIDYDFFENPNEVDNWLLVWNPSKSPLDIEPIVNNRGYEYFMDWSCNRSRPQVGDYVFLLMVGQKDNNGLIARGCVEDIIEEEEDWDTERNHKQNYVVFCVLEFLNVPYEQSLKQSYLENNMPEQHWRPVASGIKIQKQYVKQLNEIWIEHYNTQINKMDSI